MGVPAATWLGLALAACYQPTAATGVPCAANGDCPGDQLCDRSHSPPVCVSTLPQLDAPRSFDAAHSPDGPQSKDAIASPDAPSDAPATALLVQQVIAKATGGSPLTATFSSPPQNGDVLVMVGAATVHDLTSVSGGGVASWVKLAGSDINCNIELWYGITDGSSSSVSIAYTGNTGIIWMNASEWQGFITPSPVDDTNANDGTTSPASAGNVVTHSGHDLLILGVAANTPNTFDLPTPGQWTAMTAVDIGSCDQGLWYHTVPAIVTASPTVVLTGPAYDAAIAAFRIGP